MFVCTKNLYLRLVNENDVDFILSLRLNPKLNDYLSPVDENKESQLNWIEDYKIREDNGLDYYFVVVDKNLGSIGLVRVYDINYNDKTFVWGSWVLKEEHPKYTALESAVLSYEFAFMQLNLEVANIFALKDNQKANNFYDRFGCKFLYEDRLKRFYKLTRADYIKLKYGKYYSLFVK